MALIDEAKLTGRISNELGQVFLDLASIVRRKHFPYVDDDEVNNAVFHLVKQFFRMQVIRDDTLEPDRPLNYFYAILAKHYSDIYKRKKQIRTVSYDTENKNGQRFRDLI